MYQILQIYVTTMYNNFDKSNNSGINNSTGPVSDWVTEKTGYAEHQASTYGTHDCVSGKILTLGRQVG